MYSYQVCIIGKSGVGKSTLINYLFGKNVQKQGTGKPCTSQGFHPIELTVGEMPVTLFDSWGLEPDKIDFWNSELQVFLDARDLDKPANEWIHSIFYCISVLSDRIEEEELKIIEDIVSKHYVVTILFTKADRVPEEKLKDLDQIISERFNNNVKTVSVCSEDKIVRRGHIKPFGKEAIRKNIIDSFIDSLALRLPYRCINVVLEYVDNWEQKEKQFIKDNTGLFKRKAPYEQMQIHTKELVNRLNGGLVEQLVLQEIEQTFKMYNYYFKQFDFDKKLPVQLLERNSISIDLPEYDSIESISLLLANLIFPFGILVTKELNYEDISKKLEKHTVEIKSELYKIHEHIQQLIGVFLSNVRDQ